MSQTGPAEPSGSQKLFRWETLKEIGPHELEYAPPVPGKACEVELVSGHKIRVWQADDGTAYFCHGLTFGGKDAPGGPVSPFTGKAVETILQQHYELVPEARAMPGDVLVWKGLPPESTPHSAILTGAKIDPFGTCLDYGSKLQTKNGMWPEVNMSLEQLVELYGESYNAYRRR